MQRKKKKEAADKEGRYEKKKSLPEEKKEKVKLDVEGRRRE